jgi:eukaryotic-like serine/threonine-protein kinase
VTSTADAHDGAPARLGLAVSTREPLVRQLRAPLREQLEPGSVVGGRYRVEAFVADGAFGAVYRATDLDVPGHVVALKLMHRPAASEEERARALREAQLIAAVSHPSVVSFKDHGLHRGRFFIVMPWYEGETLGQRLVRRGPLASRRDALRIFKQLAEALAAMHERGVVHRDVKPENILLATLGAGQPELPVLLDLGVGGSGDEALRGFTAAYVSPEMARAHCAEEGLSEPAPRVDGKADVYALCLTLFDALSPVARPVPPEGATAYALRERARGGVELPEVPELADILPTLRTWLALDPEARPSAVELALALPVLTRAEERRAERRRILRRSVPWVLLMAGLMVLLGHAWFTERAQSHTKDRQIEQQAMAIDEAREALDLLASGPIRPEDVVTLQRKNRALEQALREERERRGELERDLAREAAARDGWQAKVDGAEERVVLLERELAKAEERLRVVGDASAEHERALAKLEREYELMLTSQKREKTDLAGLVRRLVEERDRLSERLSSPLRERAARASSREEPPAE